MSALPGAVRNIGPADACPCQYDDCSAMATHEFLCESDSLGDEWMPLCQEHMEVFKQEAAKPTTGTCDWCKAQGVIVSPMRNWEEGTHGPVYDVCEPCGKKFADYTNQQLDIQPDEEEQEEWYGSMPDMDDCDIEDDYFSDPQDEEESERDHAVMMLRNRMVYGPDDGCTIAELIADAKDLGADLSHNKYMAYVGPKVVPTGLEFAFFWHGVPFVIAEWKPTGQVVWYSTQAHRGYYFSVYALLQIRDKLAAMGYPVVSMENHQTWHVIG